MKTDRHAKILELIQNYEIGTQEELMDYLLKDGCRVTQATVSRDIRELGLTKVSRGNGQQKYAVMAEPNQDLSEKFIRVFRDGLVSMDTAQNLLVVKTVPGMAMAVAAALDAMNCREIVGSIAGDDTVLCAVRTVHDTNVLMNRLYRLVKETDNQTDTRRGYVTESSCKEPCTD